MPLRLRRSADDEGKLLFRAANQVVKAEWTGRIPAAAVFNVLLVRLIGDKTRGKPKQPAHGRRMRSGETTSGCAHHRKIRGGRENVSGCASVVERKKPREKLDGISKNFESLIIGGRNLERGTFIVNHGIGSGKAVRNFAQLKAHSAGRDGASNDGLIKGSLPGEREDRISRKTDASEEDVSASFALVEKRASILCRRENKGSKNALRVR